MTRVATDIGGTFTDLVYITPNGTVGTAKSHSTPGQFEKGVMDVIQISQISPEAFSSFVHGTTVVINAITEKKGVKTALITSEGFRDVLEIGRGNRPDYFNLVYDKPKPIVSRYLRREVPGRINYKGVEASGWRSTRSPASHLRSGRTSSPLCRARRRPRCADARRPESGIGRSISGRSARFWRKPRAR